MAFPRHWPLAKPYHSETGSEYLEQLLSRTGSRFFVSRLSLIEIESALGIKMRTGEITAGQAVIARRRLAADLERRRILLGPALEERHFQSAVRLLIQHSPVSALRTLDAIQLAVALDLNQAGLISVVVASDHRLSASPN